MVLDQVRRACRRVAREADHVRVVDSRLAAYAEPLSREPVTLPELDADCHHLGRGAETLAFVLTLDAVNFGSGYFPHLRPYDGKTGYFAVAAALAQEYRRGGALSAGRLAEIRAADCARVFGQDQDGPAGELMGHFAVAWNQLGRYLAERFAGSFAALVEAAEESAERLVGLLAEMPYYRDVALFQDFEVPLLKRAQISAADLALAFGGEGWGRFHDLDRLTVFADNLVPHVLRIDGLLEYGRGLAERIDGGGEIASGSPEEVEIRACAVHACELLLEELRRRGRHVLAMELDYLLWNRGQEPRYAERSVHRTRTFYY